MSSLRTRHREFLSWVRTSEQLEVVERFGNKFSAVCLFWFDIQADGSLTGAISDLEAATDRARQIHEKWPHIRWLLTVKNDGVPSRINPVVSNQQGAQDRFIQEVHRILNQYAWVDGLDADFERLPNDQVDNIYQLYDRLFAEIKSRTANRFLHLDLPPMVAAHETIGPEKWCDYGRLKDRCDTAQIMTYGFAWAGSAPGSTAPLDWQRSVIRYAVSAFDPMQVYMGVAAYGYRWEISKYPKTASQPYRGFGGGFPDFLRWMIGELSHTDSYRGGAETQAYIPFFSYFDEQDAVHQLFLHIYDYVDAGEDADTTNLNKGWFGDRSFLTAYGKDQVVSFDGAVSDQTVADADVVRGAMIRTDAYVSPRKPAAGETEGYAKWTFHVPEEGVYDVVAQVEYPWFDQQKLAVTIDGIPQVIGEVPQHYPYHRQVHWTKVARLTLMPGEHVFEVLGAGSQYGTIFYGFRVCRQFRERREAGEATFTLMPRKFRDRHGMAAWPYENKFKLTLEAVRRSPEPALIFYDDFRDWQDQLPSDKYIIHSGAWKVNKDKNDPAPRQYAWVSGSGKFTLNTSRFTNVTVDANLRVEKEGMAGVLFKDLWFCLNMNYKGGRYELHQGGTLLATQWPGGPLALNTYYRLRMKVRGREVVCLLNDIPIIRHTLATEVGAGAWGVQSDVAISCDLLVGADSHWHYPQEAMDIILPDGTEQTLGRIPRSGITWDEKWGFFYLESGDELDTRLEPPDGMDKLIIKDWDYLHSAPFTLTEGDYPVKVRMRDQGIWLSRIYLGDADGFSIAVFPFAETILRQGDIAAYEFKARGIGLWSVGQEDPQLWHMLVDQVDG